MTPTGKRALKSLISPATNSYIKHRDATEINAFCSLTYHTTFPRFAKIKVNGKETEPLFTWLKEQKSGPLGKRIEWNFAKFLIDQKGQVVERYASKTDPKMIEKALQRLLFQEPIDQSD